MHHRKDNQQEKSNFHSIHWQIFCTYYTQQLVSVYFYLFLLSTISCVSANKATTIFADSLASSHSPVTCRLGLLVKLNSLLFVSGCQPCYELATCPGCTPPLAKSQLESVPAPCDHQQDKQLQIVDF